MGDTFDPNLVFRNNHPYKCGLKFRDLLGLSLSSENWETFEYKVDTLDLLDKYTKTGDASKRDNLIDEHTTLPQKYCPHSPLGLIPWLILQPTLSRIYNRLEDVLKTQHDMSVKRKAELISLTDIPCIKSHSTLLKIYRGDNYLNQISLNRWLVNNTLIKNNFELNLMHLLTNYKLIATKLYPRVTSYKSLFNSIMNDENQECMMAKLGSLEHDLRSIEHSMNDTIKFGRTQLYIGSGTLLVTIGLLLSQKVPMTITQHLKKELNFQTPTSVYKRYHLYIIMLLLLSQATRPFYLPKRLWWSGCKYINNEWILVDK